MRYSKRVSSSIPYLYSILTYNAITDSIMTYLPRVLDSYTYVVLT